MATETEEWYSPNTRMGQRLVTWLNRYQVDRDHETKGKPPKNKVILFALAKWRPPAWVSAHGKSKRKEMKKAHKAVWESACTQGCVGECLHTSEQDHL